MTEAIGGTRRYGQPSASAIGRFRELLAGDEPTEADVCASAPALSRAPCRRRAHGSRCLRQRARACAPPRTVSECPEFSDAEIGVVVRLRLEGWGVDAIAVELGLSYTEPLVALVRALEHMSGKTHRGRRRAISAADEVEIQRLRRQGVSVREIADAFSKSESAIRYVLRNPREEM